MRRFVVALAASALTLALLVVPGAGPAAAYPSDNVVVSGHGFGHGRGLGQYGALGYALKGMAYGDILAHYYSNTSPGTIPNNNISVELAANSGLDTIVQQEKGHLTTSAGAPTTGNNAVLVHLNPSGVFTVQQAASCGGPWQTIADNVPGPVRITPTAPSADHTDMLQVCFVGSERWYEGDIVAANGNGSPRTVNELPIETYLRGVVPRESPASWGTLGGGAGEDALKAQAVAARSYAQAENRSSWAKTCDTTSCQVYGGRAVTDSGGTYTDLYGVAPYTTTSDAAVTATAGQVRMLNNAVARTEFSSSTGGFTAGGTFPAVVDEGDDVCVNSAACNNNHNWTANVPVSAIQAAYPQVGALQSVNVTARTAADGNRRAQTVRIKGASGSVDVAATTFQAQFGLKSTWFDITNSPSGGLQGYWLVASDGGIFTFGNAAYFGSLPQLGVSATAVGMKSTTTGGGYLLATTVGNVYSFGDAPNFGGMAEAVPNYKGRIIGLDGAPAPSSP